MNSLQQKSVIITGGAHPKGMGFATAREFVKHGARVMLTDVSAPKDDPEADLKSAAKELSGLGGEIDYCIVDVTDSQQIEACVATSKEKFGRIDILFNNAGIGVSKESFIDITDEDWDLSYAVNLRGVASFCRAVLPGMIADGGGVIINNASLAGLGAIDLLPVCYTATKHGVIGLTKSLANEFGGKNIRCNAICPGSVKTQMMDNVLRRISEEHNVSLAEAEAIEAAGIAMKRSAEPEEIAKAVVFLASDEASYLTGVALPVAGGMHPGL